MKNTVVRLPATVVSGANKSNTNTSAVKIIKVEPPVNKNTENKDPNIKLLYENIKKQVEDQ